MKLKFRKTPMHKRDSYKYFNAGDEVEINLTPDEGTHVDAVHIKLLHSLDDAEIYNNWKNHSTITVSGKDKHLSVEVCDAVSPGTRWTLSLDQLTDTDDVAYKENRTMLEQSSRNAAEMRRDRGKDLLHEAVSYLEPEQQKLYRQYYVDEMTQTAIAQQEGVSVVAVWKRLRKMEKQLKEIIFKKILLDG